MLHISSDRLQDFDIIEDLFHGSPRTCLSFSVDDTALFVTSNTTVSLNESNHTSSTVKYAAFILVFFCFLLVSFLYFLPIREFSTGILLRFDLVFTIVVFLFFGSVLLTNSGDEVLPLPFRSESIHLPAFRPLLELLTTFIRDESLTSPVSLSHSFSHPFS